MSIKKMQEGVCKDISDTNQHISCFNFDGTFCVAGPLGELTAFCFLYFRRAAAELRIDYDCCLTVTENSEPNIDDLLLLIRKNEFIFTGNTYPLEFTQYTITQNGLIQKKLKERIQSFLINNSKKSGLTRDFILSENSAFLDRLRKYKHNELYDKIISKIAS